VNKPIGGIQCGKPYERVEVGLVCDEHQDPDNFLSPCIKDHEVGPLYRTSMKVCGGDSGGIVFRYSGKNLLGHPASADGTLHYKNNPYSDMPGFGGENGPWCTPGSKIVHMNDVFHAFQNYQTFTG
jgi:hypothetical protein